MQKISVISAVVIVFIVFFLAPAMFLYNYICSKALYKDVDFLISQAQKTKGSYSYDNMGDILITKENFNKLYFLSDKRNARYIDGEYFCGDIITLKNKYKISNVYVEFNKAHIIFEYTYQYCFSSDTSRVFGDGSQQADMYMKLKNGKWFVEEIFFLP